MMEKQRKMYRDPCLIYNHVGEKYSEPKPAVRLPRGTDFLELCKNETFNL